MSALKSFDPPANVTDLSDPAKDQLLRAEWSNNVNRWTETAILGNPWSVLNDQNRSYYYNPLQTDLTGGAEALISWIAFPNRILVNFSNLSFLEQMGFAEGVHLDGTFGPPPPVGGQPYGPTGPRGWQDEYCEWIALRNPQGKITQVDFTCENPEYWYTLWRFDPQVVLDLYQKLVGPQVQMHDLILTDGNGAPVIDRTTGMPAYNVTNRWNNQPSAGQITGAVHLISPPNTLGAEVYLAAAGTLLRDNPPGQPVTSEDDLIACSLYGQPGRNSDPHIGATVNGVIRGGGKVVSLKNPIGLYIQMPDFSTYQLPADPKLPAGAQPSDCWQIIRGVESMPGFAREFHPPRPLRPAPGVGRRRRAIHGRRHLDRRESDPVRGADHADVPDRTPRARAARRPSRQRPRNRAWRITPTHCPRRSNSRISTWPRRGAPRPSRPRWRSARRHRTSPSSR